MAVVKKILFWLMLYCSVITLPVAMAATPKTLLILGDSLSAGYGINPQQGWVSLLQQRLKEHHYLYQVINASISGDTTSNGLARLPAALQQHKPTLVVIELGGNDALRGIPLKTTKNNLGNMIQLLRMQKINTLLVALRLPPNLGPVYTQRFAAMYKDLAKEYSVQLVPLFLQGIDEQPSLFQPDRIHPSAAAQPRMLDNVWDVLKQML